MPCSSSRSPSAGRRRRSIWAVTTEYLSGTAAAVSIALINGIANICGVALPPLMGYIKDTTNTYDYALLLVAAALVSGGALGLYLGPLTARANIPIRHPRKARHCNWRMPRKTDGRESNPRLLVAGRYVRLLVRITSTSRAPYTLPGQSNHGYGPDETSCQLRARSRKSSVPMFTLKMKPSSLNDAEPAPIQ